MTQLAIKRLFKFPPHPYASTLRGEIEHMKSALKWSKMPKTIRDITDSNLEKDNEILIIFGTNISDITGHQMAVATWDKKKKEKHVNLIIPDT